MKRILSIFMAVLLVVMPSLVAAKSNDNLPYQIETQGMQSLLLNVGQQNVLIGGGEAQTVLARLEAQQIETLDFAVAVCAHEEHMAALQEIAQRMNAVFVGQEDELALAAGAATWENGVLRIKTDKETYRFGAQDAEDGTISYRCDGAMISFKAKTNESAVNVRADTNTKSSKVGQLKRGEVLTVLVVVLNNAGEYWYEVKLSDGTTGYIRSDLIESATDAEVLQETEAVQKAENRYIGNKNSKKFHRPTCHTLPSAKNMVYLDSRDYAIAKGYTPCKNCDP